MDELDDIIKGAAAAFIIVSLSVASFFVGRAFSQDRREQGERMAAECVERGGHPDRYGFWGNQVTCYVHKLNVTIVTQP